ncbi:uncharacterized protein (TIGR00375 family) [Caldalkalibacillus uzonensis]|uniref:Uncharacterized protein (TIGR00375 family) n=1 Tax=Caldalkalibacillus uzonensis TaxID=353224 RepID=A0ABU0CVS6_9BACI|nr:endonuclease Q family protein [Caldalkalibacillus uzonensis]MDQ0339152.1 uncharacterized protein (TIGR00375 family) [Caldalkalibacillus uzonensis]
MGEQTIFADLHIHIGRTKTAKQVKIAASGHMTISAVLKEASTRKGLDMIGVIDCHVPEVLAELKQLIREGRAESLSGGGIRYGRTTLILGTEMEIWDESCRGPIHVLCYLPTLEVMTRFSTWMSKYQKNMTLSSQRSYVSMRELQQEVRALEGLFVPAHVFTPYKSVYGRGVETFMGEVMDLELVDGIELGLSSDSNMADQLPELHSFTFLTNSDAHSLPKIGREYQQLQVNEADFAHLKKALRREDNQRVIANYGLDPKLGKYHREVSQRLHQLAAGQQSAILNSPAPGTTGDHPPHRPPYIYQVPLEFIPGLGPKRLQKLINVFGSEMNVIHYASIDQLQQWIPTEVANMIVQARAGQAAIVSGGGGRYGKVSYTGEEAHRIE